MKPAFLTYSFAAVALVAVAGCNNSNSKPAASLQPTPAVANVEPSQAPMVATPAADQQAPVDTSTPAPVDTAFQTSASSPAPMGGGKYVVKAGDTLYRIAVTHYGSGKEWHKIVAANPGVSPQHLRVGQTLILP